MPSPEGKALSALQICRAVFFVSIFQFCVGADAHIGPLESFEFAADFCKNGAFCRADVGIGPYGFIGRLRKRANCELGSQFGKEETALEDKGLCLQRPVSSKPFLTRIGPYTLLGSLIKKQGANQRAAVCIPCIRTRPVWSGSRTSAPRGCPTSTRARPRCARRSAPCPRRKARPRMRR